MRYTSSSNKELRIFFEKKWRSSGRKTKASYLMTVTLLVQKVVYIFAVLLESERSLYLLSVLRNMSQEWEIFFNFLSSFLPKNTKYETKLTSFLNQNIAYKTLVQFTKTWTLYLVSVLRYRGSTMKSSQNYRFFKKSLKKTHEAEFFAKIFFG